MENLFFSSFLSPSGIYFSPMYDLDLSGSYNRNARVSVACREGRLWMDQNIRQVQKNLWSSKCQVHHQRQHRTEHKGHTPSSRIEIIIHDPATNRIWAAGLGDRDFTDRAMTTKCKE